LHLEVAVVGGKELFARRGATRFQGDDPAAFVTAGMIGSGDFSATPHNLFVSDAAWITAPSEAGLPGRITFLCRPPDESVTIASEERGNSGFEEPMRVRESVIHFEEVVPDSPPPGGFR
jgi:hypothetical protein